MKICLLAPEFPPVWGGVGTYSFELARHLPANIEVHIMTPRRAGFDNHLINSNTSKVDEYLGSNVHIHHISMAKDSFFYNASFQNACAKIIPNFLKEEKIDILHSQAAHMPDLLLTFRKLGVPIITTIHTTIKSQRIGTKASNRKLREIERTEKATYFLYPALRLAEKFYFKKKRFNITPSLWMKNWLENSCRIETNIKVIPNCVDMNDYNGGNFGDSIGIVAPKLNKNTRIILFAGRMIALKGIDVLINAIPEILKNPASKDFLFLFAGPGDFHRFQEVTNKFDVARQCLFLGPLNKETIIQLIKRSELVVLPSLMENSPYIILESMACGTPVVASNVGGIPEIITNGHDGYLVTPGSSISLATAIGNLLEDEILRRKMGQEAKATIKKRFSWDSNLHLYTKVYDDAVA